MADCTRAKEVMEAVLEAGRNFAKLVLSWRPERMKGDQSEVMANLKD